LTTFCYNLDEFNKNSPPTFILPALAHLLHNNDELIIKEACHAFIYFQGSDEVIQEVVDAGVVPRLVALLQHREVASVPCPNHCPIFSILRTIGNIASGTSDQAKAVVSAGAVTPLISFLGSHRDVAYEAVWALSSIAEQGPGLRNCDGDVDGANLDSPLDNCQNKIKNMKMHKNISN
jgi:importin subunit alpha-2